MIDKTLFTPYVLGRLALASRFVAARLTCNCKSAGPAPSELAPTYHVRCASIGLNLPEATGVAAQAPGCRDTSGLYMPEQIAGWRKIAKAIHAETPSSCTSGMSLVFHSSLAVLQRSTFDHARSNNGPCQRRLCRRVAATPPPNSTNFGASSATIVEPPPMPWPPASTVRKYTMSTAAGANVNIGSTMDFMLELGLSNRPRHQCLRAVPIARIESRVAVRWRLHVGGAAGPSPHGAPRALQPRRLCSCRGGGGRQVGALPWLLILGDLLTLRNPRTYLSLTAAANGSQAARVLQDRWNAKTPQQGTSTSSVDWPTQGNQGLSRSSAAGSCRSAPATPDCGWHQ